METLLSPDRHASMTSLLQELEQAKRLKMRAYAQLMAYGVGNIALFASLMPHTSSQGLLIAMALCEIAVAALSLWWRPKRLP
jgi:hypothetical protein